VVRKMPIYSCFFRSNHHSHKEDDGRLSRLSSREATDTEFNRFEARPSLPALIRQESFKRSRSFIESPSMVTIPYEPVDSKPKIESLSSAEEPLNSKKEVQRGVKRTSENLFEDAILIITPESRQIEIGHKIANHLMKTHKESRQIEIGHKIANHLMKTHKGQQEPVAMFVGEQLPAISFIKYVERLIKFTNKWAEEKDGPESIGVRCAVLAVQYLERADVKLTCKAMHRYFMVAYLLGIKLIFDYYMSNSFWGDVAGCSLKKINEMEMQFCSSLEWRLSVNEESHQVQLSKFQN